MRGVPAQWLLLDDKQLANPFSKELCDADAQDSSALPKTFVQGLTMIWMCQKERLRLWQPLRNQLAWHVAKWRLDLWRSADTAAGPSQEALDDILKLLQ